MTRDDLLSRVLDKLEEYRRARFDSDVIRVPAVRKGYLGIRHCELLDLMRDVKAAMAATPVQPATVTGRCHGREGTQAHMLPHGEPKCRFCDYAPPPVETQTTQTHPFVECYHGLGLCTDRENRGLCHYRGGHIAWCGLDRSDPVHAVAGDGRRERGRG